jgi:hypothetical protein
MASGELSELQERAARNQSRFRELNERVEAWNAAHAWVDPPMPDWVCECVFETCTEPVQLTVSEYEAVRSEPTHFFVSPSSEHVVSGVERVLEEHERYWVVEKVAHAAEASETLDPRTDA